MEQCKKLASWFVSYSLSHKHHIEINQKFAHFAYLAKLSVLGGLVGAIPVGLFSGFTYYVLGSYNLILKDIRDERPTVFIFTTPLVAAGFAAIGFIPIFGFTFYKLSKCVQE